MQKIDFHVAGMTCGGCAKSIERALSSLSGVESVAASHSEKQVEVVFDAHLLSLETLKQTIEDAGFEVLS